MRQQTKRTFSHMLYSSSPGSHLHSSQAGNTNPRRTSVRQFHHEDDIFAINKKVTNSFQFMRYKMELLSRRNKSLLSEERHPFELSHHTKFLKMAQGHPTCSSVAFLFAVFESARVEVLKVHAFKH